MAVKPIPEGYHTVTPYLTVQGVAKLLDFVKRAFGAEELARMPAPGGGIAHAEVRIGDSIVMMGEPMDASQQMPASLYVYMPAVDAVYKRAIEAGATSVQEPTNQFYGDRRADVKDPCGNMWYIATRVEDVSPEEMAHRQQAAAPGA